MKISHSLAVRAGKMLALAAFVLAVPAAHVRADVSLVFSTNDIVIKPGDAFQFTASLLTTNHESLLGVSYFLQTPDGSNGLQISQRDTTGTAFPDLIASDSEVLLPANALLNSANGSNLGGLVSDLTMPMTQSSAFLATFRLQSLPSLLPGIYTLTPYNATATDLNFDDLSLAVNAGNSLRLTVVPEPGAMTLLAVGTISALGVLRRRRHA